MNKWQIFFQFISVKYNLRKQKKNVNVKEKENVKEEKNQTSIFVR